MLIKKPVLTDDFAVERLVFFSAMAMKPTAIR
jgi:hypothetical protein